MILKSMAINKYFLSLVNRLAGTGGKEVSFCWQLILIYVTLKWLQGGGTGSGGLLNIFRSFLWIRIQQYTTREIQVIYEQHPNPFCIFSNTYSHTYI